MLTRKQKELLFLIRDKMNEEGIPPSFDEMKAALGLRSKSGIHRLITGLEERGFIKRLPHRARALEVLRLPDPPSPSVSTTRRAGIDTYSVPAALAVQAMISIPLYGRIAAGTPIEAIADPTSFVDVPQGLLARYKKSTEGAEHYALEIAGDSMIEAGIMDGDQVIIQKTNQADNGAIVVALVDDAEATLKYIEKRADGIALIPANARYETRILSASRVKVQGRLVGLLRRYN